MSAMSRASSSCGSTRVSTAAAFHAATASRSVARSRCHGPDMAPGCFLPGAKVTPTSPSPAPADTSAICSGSDWLVRCMCRLVGYLKSKVRALPCAVASQKLPHRTCPVWPEPATPSTSPSASKARHGYICRPATDTNISSGCHRLIELRRLLDGDLRGARSAKEPIDLVCDPFPVVDLVRTVRHQPAPPDVLAEWHCGREAMAKGELHERRGDYTALPRNNEERVGPVRQRFAESSLRCLSPRARERS